MKRLVYGLTLPVVLIFLCGCKAGSGRVIQSPPHYDFGKVFKTELDSRLYEISGLAWDTDRNEFFAHNDETGNLYILERETKQIKQTISFGPNGDYEDVAIYNGIPYVLRSDGSLFRVKVGTGSANSEVTSLGRIGIKGPNDFETLYADTARKALVMMCKNCKEDEKTVVSAFAYYPDSVGFVNTPVFSIDVEKVRSLSPHKTSRFQPSAAAIHPILKKLFIVSSASRQLVIAGIDGEVESVYELGKQLFPQPEGLTFKNNGDIYFSNEGVASRANILRFIFHP